mmetsp:Transcript_125943/g.403238  ORF Transcript_125943/g.403238 Transcript_125943/m.403238 type:complete len:209 (+) Transcript_125943:747-1373(+)
MLMPLTFTDLLRRRTKKRSPLALSCTPIGLRLAWSLAKLGDVDDEEGVRPAPAPKHKSSRPARTRAKRAISADLRAPSGVAVDAVVGLAAPSSGSRGSLAGPPPAAAAPSGVEAFACSSSSSKGSSPTARRPPESARAARKCSTCERSASSSGTMTSKFCLIADRSCQPGHLSPLRSEEWSTGYGKAAGMSSPPMILSSLFQSGRCGR